MLELLAPAGSPEAVRAAVENGAGAVYLGCGDFNARRRAKNFTWEELAQAVSYCHIRGVKVYLTLNTLVSHRELPAALDSARQAMDAGVDAVLVQDIGLASLLRRTLPDLPLHASTQMTVHSLDGVKLCADLGMERVVLSRELSRDAISHICAHSPVEIEIFVHGALCMCYSGQCFLSAMVGTRSGNRGLCAQPCRLPYNGSHPLSLKDMSLAGHLRELDDMGVACVKVEGRMKRPEYVAVVTRIYAAAIREGREPSAAEVRALTDAFSRDGFTQGYYLDQKGPSMFGTRQESAAPEALFAQARESYQKPQPLVPVEFSVSIRPSRSVTASASDRDGHTVTATAAVPEQAVNKPLTEDAVREQLSKTGGTPFFVEKLDVDLAPGLALPKSALNGLRRELLDGLTALRAKPPALRMESMPTEPVKKAPIQHTGLVFTLSHIGQLTAGLWRLSHKRIDLPVEEFFKDETAVRQALSEGAVLSAALPRICWDKEKAELSEQLAQLRDWGVQDALVPTWDLVAPAKEHGLTLHGDFGLGVYNPATLSELERLGFGTATLSFELKLPMLRDLAGYFPSEAVAYGRVPLMMLEQPPGGRLQDLTDRKGVTFPVRSAPGGRAELLNSQVLYLADKPEWKSLGLDALRLLFTGESPEKCVQIAREYQTAAAQPPKSFTRGLYYRDVE